MLSIGAMALPAALEALQVYTPLCSTLAIAMVMVLMYRPPLKMGVVLDTLAGPIHSTMGRTELLTEQFSTACCPTPTTTLSSGMTIGGSTGREGGGRREEGGGRERWREVGREGEMEGGREGGSKCFTIWNGFFAVVKFWLFGKKIM